MAKSVIRILHVPGSLRVGGLENVAMNFIRFSDREKYAYDYLVYGETVEPFEEEVGALGGRVFHIPYPHDGLSAYEKAMREVMRAGNYDVVHAHSLFNEGFVLRAAAKEGIPVRIAHAHDDRSHSRDRFVRECYYSYARTLIRKYATGYVACSVDAGHYLFGKGKKPYYLHNGIDAEKYAFDPVARERVRRELFVEDALVVGHVGRLSLQKNQLRLLSFFRLAHEKDPRLLLLIAGEGEERENLEKTIHALGLSSACRLLGNRSDVPALLSAFDCFALPSFHEGVSISLVEAQTAGLPCLASVQAATAPEVRLSESLSLLDLSESDERFADALLAAATAPRDETALARIRAAGYDARSLIVDAAENLYGRGNAEL